MVGIQHITRKRRVLTLMILVSVLLVGTPLFAFAALTSFQEWVLGFSMGTGGFFAGVGGLLLDKTVTVFILQMGDWFVNKGVGAVVTSIWMMIRDLFNILFIFTLVYIGLRTILNSEDSGSKKMLGMLIAAALLINFSLYIAKVVVDVANFTAVQVYTTATSGITGTYGLDYVYNGAGGGILSEEKSLAGAYMQVLDISGWFSTGVIGDRIYTYSFIMLFFLMFLGFVFAYGAIMLTARFIAIIFYLMFSPFMFLGWILPQFQQYATKWWKGFIGYSFYAPIYLFMLYIGLYSLQQIKTGLGIQPGKSYGAAFEGTTSSFSDSTMSVFLLFVIGTGFLVGAMKVAGIVSGGGAAIGMGAMDKFGRKITTGFGRSAAGSATGFLGRNSIGRLGAGALQASEWMEGSRTGRNVKRFATALSLGTLDEQTRRKAFTAAREGKYGGTRSHDSNKKWSEENRKLQGEQSSKQKLNKNIKTGGIELERSIADASGNQLENLGSKKLAQLSVAGALSGSQFESLMKSDKLNDTQKRSIATARHNAVKNKLRVDPNDPNSRVKIEDASTTQLEALGAEFIESKASALTETQMSDLKKKLTETEFERIKTSRKNKLWAEFNTNPTTAFHKASGTRKKDKEIGKLPDRILNDPRSLDFMNPNVLKTILEEESLNPVDRARLRTNITGNPIYTGPQKRAFTKFFDSALGSQF